MVRDIQSENSKAWDLIAEDYDEDFGEVGDWFHKFVIYPEILNLIGDIEKRKVVDLGCSTGTFSRILSRRGAEVLGIDSSPEMIRKAIARNENIHNKVVYSVEDLTKKLLLKDSSYDIALLVMVLHSIEDISIVLNETHRLLKSKGELVIVIPHPCFTAKFRSLNNYDPGKYLSDQKAGFVWKQFAELCNSPTEFYIRSLAFYFDKLTEAKFKIKALREPAIINEAKDNLDIVHTIEVYDRLKEIPSFLVLKCEK